MGLGLVIGLLTACVPVEESPQLVFLEYQLDEGGVAIPSVEQRIDFGRTDHSTILAMTKLVGTSPTDQGICGEVQWVAWKDGAKLFFTGGDFRGWQMAQRAAGRTCASA